MGRAVLIIEDEAVLAKTMGKYLGQRGYEVRLAGSGPEGLEALTAFLPDAVILDFNLPGGLDGLTVLERIHAFDPAIKVIMVTGHGNVRLAVEAMKAGAYDYLGKPLVLSELELLLDRALEQSRTEGQLSYFHDREATRGSLDRIIGDSPAIRHLKGQLSRIVEAAGRLQSGPAPSVLVSGETGTGKELVARALHFGGPRAAGPFIALNVATIPAHLVESELFGYERGAFTDARERKPGLVDAADGGTLFLDEIGELEPAAQAKLLKLLEDRSVRRLGSVRDHAVDIQILSATNRSLPRMVADGRFREDLYYRLNTLTVQVPPLRERDGDLLTLARHFLGQFGAKYGKPGLSLDQAAEAALRDHPWPGNIRELRNVMEQAVLYCAGREVRALDLALPRVTPAPAPVPVEESIQSAEVAPPSPATTLDAMERDMIERTLREVDGNVSKAARRLGITRDRLRYRIEKYGFTQND
ncbi:sigma-54-dependent transcriptional regulator [Thiocystis violacea]|uniref:sigma-54-dependent transcriptional regulator n=1 Tax=Thiocystis violacea TaxID=13725 RepID=UPI00190835F2|nr:sigma-54 dependent transcriptional regulator [Thiocystis violacea]MBK1717233.1 sigma-54-dependent Fis family transcriptional regulator [Thiocystis violacea]